MVEICQGVLDGLGIGPMFSDSTFKRKADIRNCTCCKSVNLL